MTNLLYALTDHDHSEAELAPWLAECGTGDPMTDGHILTALDRAWGHWGSGAKAPLRPFSDPEYLAAVGDSPWRWDDRIPAALLRRGLDEDQWRRILAAMNDLGRFGLSDTAITRRELTSDEYVAAIRDNWEMADLEACMASDLNAHPPFICAACDLRLLAEEMDPEPKRMGGLVRYRTWHALAGFDYLTFEA